jgi:hypothetical protein
LNLVASGPVFAASLIATLSTLSTLSTLFATLSTLFASLIAALSTLFATLIATLSTLIASLTVASLSTLFASLIAALFHEPPDFGRAVRNHVQEVAEVLAERAALALQVVQREPAHVRLLKVAVLRVRRDGPQISGFLDEAIIIVEVERQAIVVVHAH